MLTKTKPRHSNAQPVPARAVVVLAGGLLIVTAFQAALTFGAPLGAAAQGGTHSGQPGDLRLVTGLSAVLWLFAVLLVLARGGHALVPLPDAVTRVGTWVLVGLLGLGTLMNFASSSPWERCGWGPFTLVLLILAVVLARRGLPPAARLREPRDGH